MSHQQFLKIENPGVAPVEGFTLLGVSTTRYAGSSGTTGQFGSGFKHAINLFLQQDLKPTVFCGNLRLDYYTELLEVDDGLFQKGFHQVCVQLSGKDEDGAQVKRKEKLGWVLENGELDWTDLSMACREFVSNAFDRSFRQTGDYSSATFEIVNWNQVRAKSGTTRIYLPLTEDVAVFYSSLSKRFLFASTNAEVPVGLLSKDVNRHITGTMGPVIFRKGVRVREMEYADDPSLFDYNFGDDVKIDESRNMSDYTVTDHACKLIAKATKAQKKLILEALDSGKNYWEFTALNSKYYLSYYLDAEDKQEWKEVYEDTLGKKVPCSSGMEVMLLLNKHYSGFVVPEAWYGFLAECGITNSSNKLSKEEKEGTEVLDADEVVENVFDLIWGFLVFWGYTCGKEKPALKVFRKMENERKTKGYYRDNTVFINSEIIGSVDMTMTLWEELAHHCTGAEDFSRPFQEFLLKIMSERIYI
jgi:hypothetical protein